MGRPLGKIGIVDPARRHQGPIKMLLAHSLGCPGHCPVLRREPGIEIEPVFFLNVKADERRIGNNQAVVIDVRQLAFWRLAKPAAICAVVEAGELQQQHGFDNKRTCIWKPEVRPKGVERDHGSGLPLSFDAAPPLHQCVVVAVRSEGSTENSTASITAVPAKVINATWKGTTTCARAIGASQASMSVFSAMNFVDLESRL